MKDRMTIREMLMFYVEDEINRARGKHNFSIRDYIEGSNVSYAKQPDYIADRILKEEFYLDALEYKALYERKMLFGGLHYGRIKQRKRFLDLYVDDVEDKVLDNLLSAAMRWFDEEHWKYVIAKMDKDYEKLLEKERKAKMMEERLAEENKERDKITERFYKDSLRFTSCREPRETYSLHDILDSYNEYLESKYW